MKRAILLFLLLASLAWAQDFPVTTSGLQIGAGPVQIPKSGLPSWLTSDYAPVFNGVNQYAATPQSTSPWLTNNWTVMHWVRTYQLPSSGRIWSCRNTVPGGSELAFSSNQLAYYSEGSAKTWYISASEFPLSIGTWFHAALTCGSDGRLSLYKDGVLATYTTGIATNTIPAWLNWGKYGAAVNNYYLNGSIAEASIWSRALTQSEILRYKDKRLKGTETGLVALYHLNDGPGNASQTLVDSVGGKNAIASNTIQWTQRNGYSAPDVRSERYCLSFDGVDDYASGTNTGISTYPFTLEAWVEPVTVTGNQCGMGICSVATTTPYSFYAHIAPLTKGTLRIVAAKVASNTVFTANEYNLSPSSSLFSWHHIAIVFGARASTKIYLDGALVDTWTTALNFPSEMMGNIYLGKIFSGTTTYMKGKHAEFRLWNTARTQTEIQANMYTQMTGSEPGLVYYYRGNEGTGTTLTNLGSAGSAGNLTLYNSPTWVGRDIP